MEDPKFIPLETWQEYPVDEMKRRSNHFYKLVRRRRTVRQFSDRPVPREVIEKCLLAAGTAPSGANMQPWHFAVATDPGLKRKIREPAEELLRQGIGRHSHRNPDHRPSPRRTGDPDPHSESNGISERPDEPSGE